MSPTHNRVDNLLNEHDVARITGLSVASVRRWRLLRQGPNISSLVRPSDIGLKTSRHG